MKICNVKYLTWKNIKDGDQGWLKQSFLEKRKEKMNLFCFQNQLLTVLLIVGKIKR